MDCADGPEAFFLEYWRHEQLDYAFHLIRSAYGYTDWEVVEHIIRYGDRWLERAIECIFDDRSHEMEWDLYVAPLGRTPMDKKGAASMTQYWNRLKRYVQSISPLRRRTESDKWERLRRQAAEKEAKIGQGRTD